MQVLKNIVILQFISIIVIVFLQVCLRYLFNKSIAWTEEYSRFTFIWIIFLGTVIALDQGSHFIFDALVALFPKKLQKIINIFADSIVLFVLIFITFWGFKLSFFNMGQYTPIMRISYGFLHIVIPISSSIMSIIKIKQLLSNIRAIIKY